MSVCLSFFLSVIYGAVIFPRPYTQHTIVPNNVLAGEDRCYRFCIHLTHCSNEREGGENDTHTHVVCVCVCVCPLMGSLRCEQEILTQTLTYEPTDTHALHMPVCAHPNGFK